MAFLYGIPTNRTINSKNKGKNSLMHISKIGCSLSLSLFLRSPQQLGKVLGAYPILSRVLILWHNSRPRFHHFSSDHRIKCQYSFIRAGIAQSVQQVATGRSVRGLCLIQNDPGT